MDINIELTSELKYDAFMRLINATETEELSVAQNGTCGYVEFYPQNTGILEDGSFDEEEWEEKRHKKHLLFRPTKRGYRDAIVALKNQDAAIDLIDTTDEYGFVEFEKKIAMHNQNREP